VQDWAAADPAARAQAALRSPYLATAIESYRNAFALDLNQFYPGLVALSLLTIRKELADRFEDVWEGEFPTEEDASAERRRLEADLTATSGAVRLALDADKDGEWAPMSRADYQFLVAAKPSVVLAAYRAALGKRRLFHSDAARKQLQIFADLGLKNDRIADCLAMFAEATAAATTPMTHVVVFSGHRVDAPDRKVPRFPQACVESARQEIREYLTELAPTLGIAAGASGGDIIFHEVCNELHIPSVLRLVVPPGPFVNESVADSGADWVDRFWRLKKEKEVEGRVSILSDDPVLPAWLQRKADYSIWQRANLWMLNEAMALNPQRLTVLALWNGDEGDGPGGTKDLIEIAKGAGGTPMIIDTKALCT